jgi:hypothetical protein
MSTAISQTGDSRSVLAAGYVILHKPSRASAIAVIGIVAVIIAVVLAKYASREYLKSHHSTPLVSWLTFLVPPDDLYDVVARKEVQYGRVEKIEIKHRYAGGYDIDGRFESGLAENIEGHLSCDDFSIRLKYWGDVLDREGAATGLGYYIADADWVGKTIECEILLKRDGHEGVETIEISRGSDK